MTDEQGVSVKGAVKKGGADGERVTAAPVCQSAEAPVCGQRHHTRFQHENQTGRCFAGDFDSTESCGCKEYVG